MSAISVPERTRLPRSTPRESGAARRRFPESHAPWQGTAQLDAHEEHELHAQSQQRNERTL